MTGGVAGAGAGTFANADLSLEWAYAGPAALVELTRVRVEHNEVRYGGSLATSSPPTPSAP